LQGFAVALHLRSKGVFDERNIELFKLWFAGLCGRPAPSRAKGFLMKEI